MPQPTQIVVKGHSKQAVGEIAAQIRKVRPPEPYKGKGVRYAGEYVQRKVGQARMTVATKPKQRLRRRRRVRAKVRGTAERPRLSVFRSNRGVNAQLIDDVTGRTLAAVNWTESDIKALKSMEQAKRVGTLIAERAKAAGGRGAPCSTAAATATTDAEGARGGRSRGWPKV